MVTAEAISADLGPVGGGVGAGGYLMVTNSSSEAVLQVVAVDVLIDISTLRALVAIGSVKAELYFLDSVGSETLP